MAWMKGFHECSLGCHSCVAMTMPDEKMALRILELLSDSDVKACVMSSSWTTFSGTEVMMGMIGCF